MPNLVEMIFLDSIVGVPTRLDAAGTTLENPFVYDSAARDPKAMADRGLLKICSEKIRLAGSCNMIEQISFERLR